jgi:hypothetical protein
MAIVLALSTVAGWVIGITHGLDLAERWRK